MLVISGDAALIEEARYGLPDDLEVMNAPDALAAAPLLEEHPPALVIVDLRAGNAGGFALAKDMHQIAALREVPIYILLQRVQDRWLAEQAGADLYAIKPVETSALVADALSLIR